MPARNKRRSASRWVGVRAAAVSALARFGALCDDLLPNILVLLGRCQLDNDDEVRDRATYFKVS